MRSKALKAVRFFLLPPDDISVQVYRLLSRLSLGVKRRLDLYLSACQLGVTIASLGGLLCLFTVVVIGPMLPSRFHLSAGGLRAAAVVILVLCTSISTLSGGIT